MLSNLNTPEAKLYKSRILYFVLFYYHNNPQSKPQIKSNIEGVVIKLTSSNDNPQQDKTNMMENTSHIDSHELNKPNINNQLLDFIKKAKSDK